MPPFDFDKEQTHFKFTFESSMHKSEKQNEGKQVERDLVVAPDFCDQRNLKGLLILEFFSMLNVQGRTKGYALIQASTLVKATTCSGGTIDSTLSSTIVKDECANPVVETNVEGATSILVQLKTIIISTTIALSLSTVMEELGVDVKVEGLKDIAMEK